MKHAGSITEHGKAMDMYTVARKWERPWGKIDVVGSPVDLGHLPNNHDGRLYPRGSTGYLPGFSPHALCRGTLAADKWPGWGATT